MTALMPRLVLGCARLDSGVSARSGQRLVTAACAAGITQIDTAPSYGLGGAERVVGLALRDFPEVRVTAKLGSVRPAFGMAKSLARLAKRSLAGSRAEPQAALPPQPGLPVNRFEAEPMLASFGKSMSELGRIDQLLLHDPVVSQITPNLLELLNRLAGEVGAIAGYASAAAWDLALDRLFSDQAWVQCAMSAEWLSGTTSPPSRRALCLHGVVKAGMLCADHDGAFARSLDLAAQMVPEASGLAAQFAALYALASCRIPEARLIVASSDRDRLESLLAAIAAIDRHGLAPAIAARFDSAYPG